MQVRFLPGDSGQIADEALTLLASGTGDADHAAARQQAGTGLDYIRAVEQVLREELKIASVFTI